MHDETRSALEALQAAIGSSGSLPNDPVEALIALAGEAEAFRVREPEAGYADLILALAPAPAEIAVAAEVTGLVAFETDWWQHTAFYVDRTADPDGRHRVYVRDEEQLPGLPLHTLGSIADLARGWAEAAEGHTKVMWKDAPEDDWEKGPTSGSFVFETLLRASVSSQWALAGIGAFSPTRPELADQPLPVEPSDPGRVLCLHALRVLRLAGEFTLPLQMELEDLGPEHRAYIRHLRELEGAFAGEVPPTVKKAASAAGPLRKSAKAWLKGFEEATEPAFEDDGGLGELGGGGMDPLLGKLLGALDGGALDPEPEPDDAPRELTTFEKRLRKSVGVVVDKLVDDGEVEVLQREMLLDELTRVAEEARSPKHLLKKLVNALVDSEAVDEIYATDDQLREAFSKGLGEG